MNGDQDVSRWMVANMQEQIRRHKDMEPLVVIATDLARDIDPVNCGNLMPGEFRIDESTPANQKPAMVRAFTIVLAVCAFVEMEYRDWVAACGKDMRV